MPALTPRVASFSSEVPVSERHGLSRMYAVPFYSCVQPHFASNVLNDDPAKTWKGRAGEKQTLILEVRLGCSCLSINRF
jgi:hypothetical protein